MPAEKKKVKSKISSEPSWDEIGKAVGVKIEKYANEGEKINYNCCGHHVASSCTGGVIYGLGFVGAVIYYISTATNFWIGVLGLLKAIVWPAFLVFELLKYLGI